MALQPSSNMCAADGNELDGSANCCCPDEPPDISQSANCNLTAAGSNKNPAAVTSSQQLQMKKSSFQITYVVPKTEMDSVDDLDDVTNTEDVSSDVHAAEVHSDHWSSAETIHSPAENSPRSPSHRRISDSASQAPYTQSRFRIVKVESRAPSRVRGRWTCMDFSDPPLVTETSSSEGTSTGENACATAAPIYFVDNAGALQVQFTPAFVYSGDHLVLERTPLNTLADNNIYDTVTPERNSGVPNGLGLSGVERLEPVTSLSDLADAVGRPGDFAALASATLLPSDSNDNADSGAGTFAIDNKIEQAMDLVKSHLMFAVHEEVELLKEQIKDLMLKNTRLEYENEILRANASPETLAQLDANPVPVTGVVTFSTNSGPSAPS